MSSTSLTKSGMADWLLQRVSAIIIFAFVLCVAGFVGYSYLTQSFDYASWHAYFSRLSIRIFTFIALLSIISHLWIGIWTVITDYIKPPAVRILSLLTLLILCLSIIIWGGFVLISL